MAVSLESSAASTECCHSWVALCPAWRHGVSWALSLNRHRPCKVKNRRLETHTKHHEKPRRLRFGGQHEAHRFADLVGDKRSADVLPIRRASFDLRSYRTGSLRQPLAGAGNDRDFAFGFGSTIFWSHDTWTRCGLLLDDGENRRVWTADLYSVGGGSTWSGGKNLRTHHVWQRRNRRNDTDRNRISDPDPAGSAPLLCRQGCPKTLRR